VKKHHSSLALSSIDLSDQEAVRGAHQFYLEVREYDKQHRAEDLKTERALTLEEYTRYLKKDREGQMVCTLYQYELQAESLYNKRHQP
jgi:hypothetical protein